MPLAFMSFLNRFSSTTDVKGRIGQTIDKIALPKQLFDLEIGWAADYDHLFGDSFTRVTDIFQLTKVVLSKGYVLLAGKGGGAKTVIINRLAQHALRNGTLPIIVILKNWTGQHYEEWQRIESQSGKVDFLLSRFAAVPLRALDLDEVPSETKRLLLFDGLNEIASRTGQEMIYAIEEYVRYAPNTAIIVTDRLVRRNFINPQRWQLAVACPLRVDEIQTQIKQRFHTLRKFKELTAEAKELLSSPYFLNAFLTEGQIAPTKSEEFRQYFLQHALDEQEVNLAATAAFDAYRSSSRTFALAQFEAISGPEVLRKLQESGALVVQGNLGFFDHHLKHDYLASRYMAQHRDEWNSATFRRVSFDSSSFETMTLTLEQIDSGPEADTFVRRVYDWNPYGAGYAMAEARRAVASREMQVVVLAMLTERRLDLLLRTGEKATDILRVIRTEDGVRFREANTLSDIFEVLNAIVSTAEWFLTWRNLFAREPDSAATDDDVARLDNDDSVLGWTTSNVLKRLRITAEQMIVVRGLLDRSPNAVVRWRAAHVLGAFPNRENLAILINGLSDTSSSVRLGCVRSLVELASRDAALMTEVFQELISHVDQIAEHRSVAEEAQWAVFIRPDKVPPGWALAALPLLGILQSKARTVFMAEQWDLAMKQLVVTYGVPGGVLG